jgi:hypothetical protein
MSLLVRDVVPVLSPNAAIDEGVGIETSAGSKLVGSWSEALYQQAQLAAPSAGSIFGFVAPYPVEVVDIWVSVGTVSTSGTIQVTHETSTTASGGGTAVMSSTISVGAGATVVVPFSAARGAYLNVAASASILATAPGTLQLAKGDRLSVTFGGTLTSLANTIVFAILKRI